MQQQEQPEESNGYASFIMSKWAEIYILSEQARIEILNNNYDHDIVHEFIAKLTRLWLELQPKVIGRSEVGRELQDTFANFRSYAFNPSGFFEEKNEDGKMRLGIEDLFKMEECLRNVIEKLEITVF